MSMKVSYHCTHKRLSCPRKRASSKHGPGGLARREDNYVLSLLDSGSRSLRSFGRNDTRIVVLRG